MILFKLCNCYFADNPMDPATAKEYIERTAEFEQTCKDYVFKYALKPPEATFQEGCLGSIAPECSPEGAPESTQQ
eukprot:SAG31_NODE_8737_length_1397_cov_1.509245_2_plen_75_part_00